MLTSESGELDAELPFTTFKRKVNAPVCSPTARVFYHFDVRPIARPEPAAHAQR